MPSSGRGHPAPASGSAPPGAWPWRCAARPRPPSRPHRGERARHQRRRHGLPRTDRHPQHGHRRLRSDPRDDRRHHPWGRQPDLGVQRRRDHRRFRLLPVRRPDDLLRRQRRHRGQRHRLGHHRHGRPAEPDGHRPEWVFANGIGGDLQANAATIRGNTVRFNGTGVLGSGTQNSLISGNAIDRNFIGLTLGGQNNTVSRNTIDQNRYGAAQIGGTNNTITGNTFDQNGIGVDLGGTANIFGGTTVTGTISPYSAGRKLSARNSTVTGNVLSQNAGDGATIYYGTGNRISDNVITGNGGNGLSTFSSDGNTITGNNLSGNRLDGAALSGIGDALTGNTITANGRNGITVTPSNSIYFGPQPSYGNTVRANTILANGGLGIDLGNDGPTADGSEVNDPLNPGPNDWQQVPVLTSVQLEGGDVVIQGTVQGQAPNKPVVLDFYANDALGGSGLAQGQTYLGSVTVTTDGSSTASFTARLALARPVGPYIDATATDPGDTSEFSQPFFAPGLVPPPVTVEAPPFGSPPSTSSPPSAPLPPSLTPVPNLPAPVGSPTTPAGVPAASSTTTGVIELVPSPDLVLLASSAVLVVPTSEAVPAAVRYTGQGGPPPVTPEPREGQADLGEISGKVWHDRYGNELEDKGEGRLEGQIVYLDLNDNGLLDPNEPWAVTDRNGEFRFAPLGPGKYTVRLYLQSRMD